MISGRQPTTPAAIIHPRPTLAPTPQTQQMVPIPHIAHVDVEKKRNAPTSSYNPPELYKGSVAIKLGALLNAYDGQVIDGAVQARNYITNRLLEISQCGDVKYELRAIELLGKLSDVGAFTEKI
jgi:hypothetical protein